MNYDVARTDIFIDWLRSLRDRQAAAGVARRIVRAEAGNFGDHKSVGGGVSELRVPVGKGYRVYYTVRGRTVVVLLCGGDKSTQASDIRRAQALAKEV